MYAHKNQPYKHLKCNCRHLTTDFIIEMSATLWDLDDVRNSFFANTKTKTQRFKSIWTFTFTWIEIKKKSTLEITHNNCFWCEFGSCNCHITCIADSLLICRIKKNTYDCHSNLKIALEISALYYICNNNNKIMIIMYFVLWEFRFDLYVIKWTAVESSAANRVGLFKLNRKKTKLKKNQCHTHTNTTKSHMFNSNELYSTILRFNAKNSK